MLAAKVAVMTAMLEAENLEQMLSGIVNALANLARVVTIWEVDGEIVCRAVAGDGDFAALNRGARRDDLPPEGFKTRLSCWRADTASRDGITTGQWVHIRGAHGVVAVIELFGAPAPYDFEDLPPMIGVQLDRARERSRTERDLRLTQGQLARLHSSDLIGFMITTIDGRVLEANDAILRMLQRTRAELERGLLRWDSLTPPELLHTDARAIEQLRQFGIAPAYEKAYVRSDGTRVPILLGAAQLEGRPGETVVFVVDITHQKLIEGSLAEANEELEQLNTELEQRVADAQRDLRALASRVEHIREEQMTHLAREIHDVLGQELTVFKVDVSWLRRRLDDAPEPIRQRLDGTLERLDAMFATVRRIASGLRPRILDDLGLIAAIEVHARELAKRTGLAIELALPDELPVDSATATVVFRILQELLTNVVRHAHAARVEVTLTATDHQLLLRVVDDGIGIPEPAQGLGLLGMRERALAAGGTLSITRGRPRGTVATLELPT